MKGVGRGEGGGGGGGGRQREYGGRDDGDGIAE